MTRITTTQYHAIKNRRKLSKEDEARLEKWLDPIEDEDTAQMRVVAYLEMLKHETGKILKFTAIPNNTFSGTYIEGQKFKSMQQAKKQVAMGLRKGLCDLLIVYVPNGHAPMSAAVPRLLFLEMKREKGGTVSAEQKEWIKVLKTCLGTKAEVATGFEDAKAIIDALIY